MTGEEQTVDGEGFVASVADTVAALERLCAAYLGIGERFGYRATAESPATRELAQEASLASARWVEPVVETHSATGMLAFAALDHVRSYAHLFASTPIPVYSHLVVARAALEAFGWCAWLADEDIDVSTRVKRDRLYQLSDGMQRKRFPMPEMKAKGAEIIARVREGAPADWLVVCNDRNLSVGGETVPATKELIAATLNQAGPTPDQLGGSLWALLSGITHSVRYGLLYSMEVAPRTSELEPLLAGMSTTSTTVHLIGAALARSAMSASDSRLKLLGWDGDGTWRAATTAAERHIAAVLASTSPPTS